jgi:pectin methylesterase-like acyl-CoA thioesterase
VISIAPGTYRELIHIDKPNIHLRSPYTDPKKTVIVYNLSAGTGRTPTMEVTADNFTADNLTIENDFNATHKQEPQGSQALALRISGDRAVLRNVRILGNQDTLYLGSRNCPNANGEPCQPARQYFSDCEIAGNVDFIYGDSKAVFENCEIRSTAHQIGFLTAQGKHYANQDSAFVFNHCKLTADPGVTDVYLGRPWRDFSATVFLNTEMGAHIVPAGWREWHPGETRRLETVYYGEFNSTGPGAHAAERDPHAKKLTPDEAARYATKRFLAGPDGWVVGQAPAILPHP